MNSEQRVVDCERKEDDGLRAFQRSAYFNPLPAALVSTNRSGSTLLLHCLDSHPQIGCERNEPLSPREPWARLKVKRHDLMRVLWRRGGYRVSMFKLTYRQLRWVGTEILQENEVRLLHLHRRNALRVIVSSIINTAVVRGEMEHPPHSFEPVLAVATVHLEPEAFVTSCHNYLDKVRAMRRLLKGLGLPVLYLKYADLVGEEGREVSQLPAETAARICQHLGVDQAPLFSQTRRINPRPLAEIVENWEEVRGAVVEGGLGRFLEK